MATLVRAPLEISKGLELKAALVELGKQAKEKLGYGRLLWATEASTKTGDTASRVAKAFERLGIEPLTTQSVEAYKAKKAHRENKGYRAWRREDWEIPLFGILGTVAAIVLITMTVVNIHDTIYHQSPFAWGWLAIPGVVATGLWGRLWYDKHIKTNVSYSWSTSQLAHYDRPVPAFALSRALELQQELPDASFGVDRLESYGHTKDPFLFMDCGSRYYLDVWDEPSFEGRRTV